MPIKFKGYFTAACAFALAVYAGVAAAHHSAAQFDFAQRVTIDGVVKDFKFTNPHPWATVELTDV
jgi:hypothetical protein